MTQSLCNITYTFSVGTCADYPKICIETCAQKSHKIEDHAKIIDNRSKIMCFATHVYRSQIYFWRTVGARVLITRKKTQSCPKITADDPTQKYWTVPLAVTVQLSVAISIRRGRSYSYHMYACKKGRSCNQKSIHNHLQGADIKRQKSRPEDGQTKRKREKGRGRTGPRHHHAMAIQSNLL